MKYFTLFVGNFYCLHSKLHSNSIQSIQFQREKMKGDTSYKFFSTFKCCKSVGCVCIECKSSGLRDARSSLL